MSPSFQFKLTRSGAGTPDPWEADVNWRISSRCESGECIEVGDGGLVRDSADPAGPVLTFGPGAWAAFTAAVKAA